MTVPVCKVSSLIYNSSRAIYFGQKEVECHYLMYGALPDNLIALLNLSNFEACNNSYSTILSSVCSYKCKYMSVVNNIFN